MNLLDVLEKSKRDFAYVSLLENVKLSSVSKGRHINLTGPGLSQKAYITAALSTEMDRGFCVVCSDELQVRQWEESLKPYFPDIVVFKRREMDFISSDANSRKQEHERIAVLASLGRGENVKILTTGTALMQRLPPIDIWNENCLEITGSYSGGMSYLEDRLIKAGYERVMSAEAGGQFSRRGDIIDIVPVSWNVENFGTGTGRGLRISFFDEEMDGISIYDLETQRSIHSFEGKAVIPPAREMIIPSNKIADIIPKIEKYGNNAIVSYKSEHTDRKVASSLESRLGRDISALRDMNGKISGDAWLEFIYDEKASFLDYWKFFESKSGNVLPVIFDEPARVWQAMDAFQADWAGRVSSALEKGQVFPIASKSIVPRNEVASNIDKNLSVLSYSTIGILGNGFPSAKNLKINGRDSESFQSREGDLSKVLKDGTSPQAVIAVNDEIRRKKLSSFLNDSGVVDSRYTFIDCEIPHGFVYPAADLWILGSFEIFASRAKRNKKTRKKGISINLFSDLKAGDRVVHDVHGIGIYKGLSTIEKNGVKRDYLEVEYAKGDTLFLPMEALDQLQKYIGGSEQNPPKLSRLGGNEWNNIKEKARESIKRLATNLIRLYAKRKKSRGHAFPPPTVWDKEFADAFPYEETDDQTRCIEEIFKDMESCRVMDRLLCGDVGFGKTEVAFRAIFKCISNGYQAALLVPTTVLAQQHYENLLKRLEGFPVKVGLLSRFAPEALQKATLKGVSNGTVDVVIGTHRVLSKDVSFKKLGLLVVDEEQRFGVDHKEGLKERYPDVDVLTLSATPIPRTLHMSLSGIRDISVIEEAPIDRRSVQTYVMEYDESVIQEAVLREIARDGQVFYLFNNTIKMEEKVANISKLLPGIKIGYAHGQMSEKQLEKVMHDFISGELDVLVCTTIVESGIDMPNVNTLIVENADTLGLAQLYQIRGRVGRSGRQAYAYITYRKEKILSEVAQHRLAAIRDFTELGAGFKIAMKDLEVRGAGNLLGGEQHGQMAAIGYDMYCRMLDEEIKIVEMQDELINSKEMINENLKNAIVRKIGTISHEDGNSYDSHELEELFGKYHSDDIIKSQISAEEEERREKQLRNIISTLSSEELVDILGQKAKYITPDTVVEIPVDAYLTKNFISDEGQRMDMYRRLVSIEDSKEYFDVLDELTDRFGDLPNEVTTLADIGYIRHRASISSISRICIIKNDVVMYLADDKSNSNKDVRGQMINMGAISDILAQSEFSGQIEFAVINKPSIIYKGAGSTPRKTVHLLRKLFMNAEKSMNDRLKAEIKN